MMELKLIMDKQAIINDTYHHTNLHAALPVNIQKSENDDVEAFCDIDPAQYNLFKGDAHGSGHADRLLDDYMSRQQSGADLNCGACLRYKEFLSKEKPYLSTSSLPPLCMRRRLIKAC